VRGDLSALATALAPSRLVLDSCLSLHGVWLVSALTSVPKEFSAMPRLGHSPRIASRSNCTSVQVWTRLCVGMPRGLSSFKSKIPQLTTCRLSDTNELFSNVVCYSMRADRENEITRAVDTMQIRQPGRDKAVLLLRW
jgi:hypothetical protein